MIDLKNLLDQPERYKAACQVKGVQVDIDALVVKKREQNQLAHERDELRHQLNLGSGSGKPSAEQIIQLRLVKEQIKTLEQKLGTLEQEIAELLFQVPNPPLADVPEGPDESGNKVIRSWGELTKFNFEPKDHLALGEALGIIDTERAAKVTGTRFAYLKGAAAWLEFALIRYAFDLVTSEERFRPLAEAVAPGYPATPFVPVIPPVMIRPDALQKMARLEPKEERYYLQQDDQYLIGSAEHTLGSMHMDEVFEEQQLPLRYIGFSTSFRREAGSYGKDTRGILRVHQFDKLEMESFTTPEDSLREQEFFVKIQETLLQGLGLPYQVVMICTGDMGGPDARQIDLECWLPGHPSASGSPQSGSGQAGQGTYRETHTADLMTDYQARRLNTRVRRKSGELQFVHMNDATAFAIGRTLIAILENYQQADGTVKVPKALQPYMPFSVIK